MCTSIYYTSYDGMAVENVGADGLTAEQWVEASRPGADPSLSQDFKQENGPHGQQKSDQNKGGKPKRKGSGRTVTLGGNNLDVMNDAYRAQLKQLQKINSRNSRNAPPLLSITFAFVKGIYGLDSKMFNYGPSWSASYQEHDTWGIRDAGFNDKGAFVRSHDLDPSNGFSLSSPSGIGASYTKNDVSSTLEFQTPFFTGVSKYDQNGQSIYNGSQIDLFSFRAALNYGWDMSIKLNFPSVLFNGAPPKGMEDEGDHTTLSIYVPDLNNK